MTKPVARSRSLETMSTALLRSTREAGREGGGLTMPRRFRAGGRRRTMRTGQL